MKAIIFAGLPQTQQFHVRKENEIKNKRIQYNHELETILDEVCKYLSINVSDVKSKNRMLRTKIARFYFMYLSKQLTDATFQQIGDVVYRNHATVIHAVKTVSGWISYDKKAIKELEDIETLINERHEHRTNAQ